MMSKIKLWVGVCLLVTFAFCGEVLGEPARTYDVHATAVDYDDLPSCGAAARMLRDRHVVVDDHRATIKVNGLTWKVVHAGQDYIIADFHGGGLVHLQLFLEMDDRGLIGQYSLFGVLNRTKDGYTRCSDTVEIRGERR